ncbi:hypothetical protein FOMPIDRAFT_1061807 [Fomitopsis schrenkii]|uniref:Ion transport domain-containing protein n=1 Tax=Fomitopsis schrenkii TaxID=2126942 RepID=S8DWP5_FOMSC|nr:hypothetical protein FOMPIDRAFT_1061807 [Fomitopsis schrenkii]
METIPLSPMVRVRSPNTAPRSAHTPRSPRTANAPRSAYAPIPPVSRAGDHFPHDNPLESIEDAHVQEIYPMWKRRLYLLLERPTSSSSAFVIHVLSTSLIIISAIVTCLETIPSFHSISPRIWFGFETSVVMLFTVEYVARCLAHSANPWTFLRWFGSFFGIMDLLSILPYYLELMLHQDTSTLFRFTILRTFRLLRVFRPFRYNNTILLTIEVMYLSFRRSQHALLALAFFVVMVLLVFSTLMYFAERGTWDEVLGTFINSDGDPSQFASIPASAWFVAVTITTVGYGDLTPRSFLGRLITIPLLVFGLLLIALPTFVLGREFSLVWEMMKENQQISREEVFNAQSVDPLASPSLMRARSSSSAWRHVQDEPQPGEGSPREAHELRDQIAELKATVEMQGALLRRLVSAMEGGAQGQSQGKQRFLGDGS